MEQREWCEEFDSMLVNGVDTGTLYACRRCGRMYRWSGFLSLKIGPCIADKWPCQVAR